MTAKQHVLEVVSKMPDNCTLEDIGYEVYVIQSIREGLAELDRGDYLTHEQARDELSRWLKK